MAQLQGTIDGLDPNVDLVNLKYYNGTEWVDIKTEDDWKYIATNSKSNLTRAVALLNITDSAFLKAYVFGEVDDKTGLSGVRQDISGIEFAAILYTGIPAKENWWGQISNKEDRIAYVQLMLEADNTDGRMYVGKDHQWVCVQFAIQLAMNAGGYNTENFADSGSFTNSNKPYTIPSLEGGYGIPIFYATGPMHAFNAVFIGDDINDPAQRNNADNWLFIEPQSDSVMTLDELGFESGATIEIYLDPFFEPDGCYSDRENIVTFQVP